MMIIALIGSSVNDTEALDRQAMFLSCTSAVSSAQIIP